jgi:hypothetical protein
MRLSALRRNTGGQGINHERRNGDDPPVTRSISRDADQSAVSALIETTPTARRIGNPYDEAGQIPRSRRSGNASRPLGNHRPRLQALVTL